MKTSPSPASHPTVTRKLSPGEPATRFTKVPNAYDVLIRDGKLAGAVQRDIIWVLMRSTWGGEKREEWASLSLKQIAERCGGIEPTNISSELKDLATRGIIDCEAGKGCTSMKRYKLTPERWKKAPPYQKALSSLPAAAPREVSEGAKLLVRPGAKGKCVPARLAPAGRDPVDFQLEYSNAGASAVEVSSTIEADTVRITFQATTGKAGDRQNERRSKGEAVFSTENSQKANTGESKRLIEYEEAIKALFSENFGKPFEPATVSADKKFLLQIIAKAGNEMPADYFRPFVRGELFSMVRRRRPIFPGILVSLAYQAERAYNYVESTREASPEAPAAIVAESLDPSKPWDQVREKLHGMVTRETYGNWFEATRQIAATKTAITVEAPDQITVEFIESEPKILECLKAAAALAGQPDRILWKVKTS